MKKLVCDYCGKTITEGKRYALYDKNAMENKPEGKTDACPECYKKNMTTQNRSGDKK